MDSFREWDSTESGYGATIMFEDGYVEIMPMAKLVKLFENREAKKNRRAQVWHDLNRKYSGVTVRKQFGDLGIFEGVVQYVHGIGECLCRRRRSGRCSRLCCGGIATWD